MTAARERCMTKSIATSAPMTTAATAALTSATRTRFFCVAICRCNSCSRSTAAAAAASAARRCSSDSIFSATSSALLGRRAGSTSTHAAMSS